MKTGKILLIGDNPEKLHGENFARKFLNDRVQKLGGDSLIVDKRKAFKALIRFRNDTVVVFPGESVVSSLFETIIFLSLLPWKKRVFSWYHNKSCKRFAHYLWPFVNRGVTHLVLNQHQVAEWPEHLMVEHFPNSVEGDWQYDIDRNTHNRFRLVWLSRVEEVKGFHLAYQVFDRLRKSDSRWSFDVYGVEGDCVRDKFPNAQFHGWVQGTEAKKKVFAEGGLFIFPSKYENETQPLVILEAMRSGLPILISRINGIDELIKDGTDSSGIAVNGYSTEEWANAAKRLQDQYHVYSKCSEALYRGKFSNKHFDRRLLNLKII